MDLTKLNLMQLTQFKNGLDSDLQFYQESLQNLKMALFNPILDTMKYHIHKFCLSYFNRILQSLRCNIVCKNGGEMLEMTYIIQ